MFHIFRALVLFSKSQNIDIVPVGQAMGVHKQQYNMKNLHTEISIR